MPRRIRKVVVIGVGTPPPLPLRPLVDEIWRIWEAKPAAARQVQPNPNDRRRDKRMEKPPGWRAP
jgi:hypothetical protein